MGRMKREQARKAGKASAEKRRNINGSERSYNVSSTDAEQNLTDVQQRKEKKRKERKDIYSADADFLWGLYPEKKGKRDVMTKPLYLTVYRFLIYRYRRYE